jgi:hypothetical protein
MPKTAKKQYSLTLKHKSFHDKQARHSKINPATGELIIVKRDCIYYYDLKTDRCARTFYAPVHNSFSGAIDPESNLLPVSSYTENVILTHIFDYITTKLYYIPFNVVYDLRFIGNILCIAGEHKIKPHSDDEICGFEFNDMKSLAVKPVFAFPSESSKIINIDNKYALFTYKFKYDDYVQIISTTNFEKVAMKIKYPGEPAVSVDKKLALLDASAKNVNLISLGASGATRTYDLPQICDINFIEFLDPNTMIVGANRNETFLLYDVRASDAVKSFNTGLDGQCPHVEYYKGILVLTSYLGNVTVWECNTG